MFIYIYICLYTHLYRYILQTMRVCRKNRVCSTIAIWVKSGIRVSSIPFADKASQSLINQQINIAYIYIDIDIEIDVEIDT